jgi:hypothetical protein
MTALIFHIVCCAASLVSLVISIRHMLFVRRCVRDYRKMMGER